MKNIAKFTELKKPSFAEGRIQIDLLDPISGKVQNRRSGQNQVFEDILFYPGWVYRVNTAKVVLLNNPYGILPNMPFLLGDIIGYGKPSTVSGGMYRGEYNPASQIIEERTLEKTRWKFQYDFLTTQANGEINMIGLTNQFDSVSDNRTADFKFPVIGTPNEPRATLTCDGRCFYSISNLGIVTIFDGYTGISTDIDISGIVGVVGNKSIGYAPETKKCYVFTRDDSIHVFSDSTFSVLENTYPIGSFMPANPLYVYNNLVFKAGNKAIDVHDFVNDVSLPNIEIPAVRIADTTSSYLNLGHSTIGYKNFVYIFGRSYTNNSSAYQFLGYIIDLSTQKVAGEFNSGKDNQSPTPEVFHPYLGTSLPVPMNTSMSQGYAIAGKMLDEPVIKTEENGMRITYELDVYW